MPRLAVLILAKNEELHIRHCVESALFADEVLVIDSGSTDKTVELAKAAGANVVYRALDDGFAAQRNFALTQTEAEWVMYLDADERITPELAREVKKTVESGEEGAYAMPRRNIAFGHWLRYGGWYPDYSLRLYPRQAVYWRGGIHEEVCFSLPSMRLRRDLLHYTYYDWERYFQKFNSYTTLMAKEMVGRGKRATLFHIVFRPWWAFLRVYLFKAGWRDGKIGFILAVFHFFYTMAKYVKLYYLEDKAGENG